MVKKRLRPEVRKKEILAEEMCADSWNWQKNNPDGYHTVK